MIVERLIADRYQIEDLIGRGGMGSVWLATDTHSDRYVVVKIVDREIASFPVAITRFLREMRIHTLVKSPHIVEVLDRGVDTELGPFLVMERLRGEDLDHRITRRGPVPLPEIPGMLRPIARALETIHEQGYVHRDVKPSNVFLCQDDNGRETAKLLDFGAVKADVPLRSDGSRTKPGMLIGTLSRMSPEQIQGNVADGRADVWGLALTVYEAAVGQVAVRLDQSMGELVTQICRDGLPTPSHRNPLLPKSFDRWFEKSTRQNRNERYASVREQFDALESVGNSDAPCSVGRPTMPRWKRFRDSPVIVELSGGPSPARTALGPAASRTTLPAPGCPAVAAVDEKRARVHAPAPQIPASAAKDTLLPPGVWPPAR